VHFFVLAPLMTHNCTKIA